MWNVVRDLFRGFMGEGLIVAWFLISLLYLYVKEQDKSKRIVFLYVPVIVLLLFFNPLFSKLFYGIIGEEIYYRMLWLVPITMVIGYTVTVIYASLKAGKRWIWLTVAGMLTVVSGSLIYANPQYSMAENPYHMPDAVVEICDAIEVEGREVMALFPKEMIQYVRQYTPYVCMPYGREVLVAVWKADIPLFDEMEKDVIDVEAVTEMAREQGCHYIVLPDVKEKIGNPEEEGYKEFFRAEGYTVYLDERVDLNIQ